MHIKIGTKTIGGNYPVFIVAELSANHRQQFEEAVKGAFVIGVSDRRENIFDEWIKIPQVEGLLYPLVTVAPLQLLAYHTAIARGLDPDRPRNLAKSVTVK